MLCSRPRSGYALIAAVLAVIFYSSVSGSTVSATSFPQRTVLIGTDSADASTGVALTSDGNILITGAFGYPTQPLPVTPAAYQAPNTDGGGAYVMKLAPNGSLQLLSLIAPNARGEAIALDAAGNIFVAGTTTDPSFQATPGAYDGGGQGTRAFVAKLTPDAASLLYATVLGPVAPIDDFSQTISLGVKGPALRVGIDGDGNAIVAGTARTGFPTTSGVVRSTFAGASEAFVAKVAADGTALMYSTFLGGSGTDEAHGLAIDGSGNAIVSGSTNSPDFATTTVLHDGAPQSAFVARISADGHALDFSTRVSGIGGAYGRGVALGPNGGIYLTGVTSSQDFPTTAAPFHPWQVRRLEGFVMQLTPNADAIVYSTSLFSPDLIDSDAGFERGSHMPISIAVDSKSVVHLVGVSGAGQNVMANNARAVRIDVQPGGGSFDWTLDGISNPNGSTYYDVAANTAGDLAEVRNTNVSADVSVVSPSYNKDTSVTQPWDDGIPGGMYTDGMVSWTTAPRTAPSNTPAGGTAVVVADGGAASITFSSVTAAGTTTLTPVDPASLNLSMPGGFALSNTSQAFEIHTTATATGLQVCLSGASLSDADFSNATILHGVNGAWQVESTTRDAATKTLCTTVSSLSPFAVGVRVDTTPPSIDCPVPTAWSNGPVTIRCQAADAGGLASSADGSFTLTATLGDGVESAAVATDTRKVCDVSGNCAMAGPFMVKIDRRAPDTQITAPVNRRYIVHEAANAVYSCTDGGSGIASCAGSVANGAAIDTTTAGQKAFAVTVRDNAGNQSSAGASYTVGFNVKVLLTTTTVKKNALLPVAIQLVDAAGVDVSSAGTAVTVTGLKQLSTGEMVPLAAWINPDHTMLFGYGSYGYVLTTKQLSAGAYELQFAAAGDSLVHTLQFTVR